MGGASTHSSKRADTTTPPPGGHIEKDPTLQHPRCVFQLLKKHYARYTPEMVADITGASPEEIVKPSPRRCATTAGETRRA